VLYAVILLAQLPGKKVMKRRKLAREKRGRNSADSLIFATTALKGYPSRHFGLFFYMHGKIEARTRAEADYQRFERLLEFYIKNIFLAASRDVWAK
jgi:hypothetical protein